MLIMLPQASTKTESVEYRVQIQNFSLAEGLHLLSVLALHQGAKEDGICFIGEEGIIEDVTYTVVDALIEHPSYEAANDEIFDLCERLNDVSESDIRNLMVSLALQIAR